MTVDGTQVGQTSATSFQVPAPLTDGPHAWRVTAADPAGLQSSMAPATVFVDTFPPAVGVRLSGRGRVGSPIHISVSYTDTEPGEPAQDASGVSSVLVRWGDGSSATVKHGKFHVYRRAGRYTVTVIVTDKAGNTTRVAEQLRIAPSRSSAHRHG